MEGSAKAYYANWTWFQRFCIRVLQRGDMPKHIGIILDGNRRYAREKGLATVRDGHVKGGERLMDVMKMCVDIKVSELTVYAFSIENFKRAPAEVSGLMALAREKIDELIGERDKLNEIGICIEIVGDWAFVPENLKSKFAQLMIMTRDNSCLKLNLAFAYTARNEIAGGVSRVVDAFSRCEIEEADVCEDVLEEAFRLSPCQPLDILIRTSGESRLSDFLLWQTSDSTFLHFVDVCWPEFSEWDLFWALFHYQRHGMGLRDRSGKRINESSQPELGSRREKIVARIRERRWKAIAGTGGL